MKKSITKTELCILQGLGEMCRRKLKEMDEIEQAIYELLRVDGHRVNELEEIQDFIYRDGEVKELLLNLKIKVKNG
jgi:hypothetical protein